MYLCLEPIFLAFIPYLIWSSYRRVGTLDILAPDLGFPLAYIIYLFCGSIAVPIQTQFGLTLPWIVWLYYIIGLVCYLLGARFMPAPNPVVAKQGVEKRFWPGRQYLIITLGLLVIGAMARGVSVLKSGLEIFHANNESARVVSAGGIWAVLTLCLDAGFECVLIYLLVKKPKVGTRVALLVCMALILLNAVATTNRTSLLRIVLAGAIVTHYAWRRFSFGAFVTVGLLAAAFASALGTFRDVSEWGDQHIQKLERQGFTGGTYWLLNGYEAVRLPTETFLMTTQVFPQLDSYTFGATSLAEFGAFLPGPTLEPSQVIKAKLRLQFVGFGAAATILAPLWADGGVIGIMVGMFLIGLGSRALHQRVLLSSNYVWILIYGWYNAEHFQGDQG